MKKRVGVLFSGGKDSTYAAWLAKKEGHELACLITLYSENPESYMFHTPSISKTKKQAELMNLPLITRITKGIKEEELRDFIEWYTKQDYKCKIYVPGNHDVGLENDYEERSKWFRDAGIVLLNDQSVTIEGLKIHGSPITPTFGRWSYMKDRGHDIKQHWDLIPEDTDILITHGPPYGFGDIVSGMYVGCEDLYRRVNEVNPKIHVYGHIHEGAGCINMGNTEFINASMLNEHYKVVHKPIFRDL